MSLTTVPVSIDLGSAAAGAKAVFRPSGWLADAADGKILPPAAVTVTLDDAGTGSADLLPTDTSGPLPAGWSWSVTFTGIPSVLPYMFSFVLTSGDGESPNLADLTMVQPSEPMAAFLALAGGTMTGPLILAADPVTDLGAATKHYVDNASGAAVASVNGHTGTVVLGAADVGADASGAAATERSRAEAAESALAASMPTLMSLGAASAAGLSAETTRAEAAESALSAAIPTLSSLGAAAAAALTAEIARAEAAEAAITLTSLGAAAASALTAEISRAEAAEAAALPLAGGTMTGALAMGAHKITGVTNGSAAQDAAAFGQLPTLGSLGAASAANLTAEITRAEAAEAALAALSASAATAAINIGTSAGETVVASVTIPAGLTAGATYRLTAWGTLAIGGTAGTFAGRSRIGGPSGTTLGTLTTGSLTLSATGTWRLQAEVTLQAPGASGTWSGGFTQGVVITGGNASNGIGAGNATKDSTASQVFLMALTLSSATSTAVCLGSLAERVA